MTSIIYHCKICKREGVTSYDEACPISDIEKWRKNICCVRCYSFYDSFSKAKRAIARFCYGVALARSHSNSKAANEALARCRTGLTVTTKRIAALCCDYYHLVNVWDEEFVNQLMEQPNRQEIIVRVYHAGLRKISNLTQP